MTLSMFFSFFWRRLTPLPRARIPRPELDFMEISILKAHDQRAMQYLRDARDIAAFEARARSMLSERHWW